MTATTKAPCPSPSHAENPWFTETARIVDIVQEIEGVATYRLQTASGNYGFQPGQFNMLYVPGAGESAISMSGSADMADSWVHTVRVAGNVTRTLARMQVGATIGLRGPFGTGWPIAPLDGKHVILVAGGLGMAPLRPLIYHLVQNRSRFRSIALILGARTPSGLLYPKEFDAWRQAGIEVQITVDRAEGKWSGHVGVVTTLLDRLPIADPQATELVTCGPEVMMKYVALSGMHRGLSASQIWVSMERNMQCAAGLCGHCQWGSEFVCKDGPVFRYDRVQSYFAVESL